MGSRCSVSQPDSSSSHGTGGVLCFGHPLLDMMTPVNEAFMREYGVAPGSVALAQPQQLPLFQRITEDHAGVVDYVPGGAAMNTARTLAWLRPEMMVSYVGALGADKFAHILKASLTTAGVRPLFEVHASKPTGTCACLVVDKERALVANLGAAVELSKAFMDSDDVRRCVKNAALYYAEGFFLNTASSPDGLLSVAKHAREANKTFCFNLNAPYISHVFKDRVDLLMPYVNILFGSAEDIMGYATVQWPKEFSDPTSPTTTTADNHISSSNVSDDNEEEEEELADGGRGPAEESVPPQDLAPAGANTALLHIAVRKIADLPSHSGRRRLVVATCGASSTVVASSGDEVRKYAVPPMPPEEMVDLNGAGDAFVAGFLAQYMLTKDEPTSAHVAHETAQNCIRHNGAVVGGTLPTLAYSRRHKRKSSVRL